MLLKEIYKRTIMSINVIAEPACQDKSPDCPQYGNTECYFVANDCCLTCNKHFINITGKYNIHGHMVDVKTKCTLHFYCRPIISRHFTASALAIVFLFSKCAFNRIFSSLLIGLNAYTVQTVSTAIANRNAAPLSAAYQHTARCAATRVR